MRAYRFAAVGCALATVWTGTAFGSGWDDGGTDSRWLNATNWTSDTLPTYAGGDEAAFRGQSGTNVEYGLIDDLGAEAGNLNLGRNGTDATLEMTGGSLLIKNFNLGDSPGEGTFVLSGGTVTVSNDLGNSNMVLGDGTNATGTVVMNGGSIAIIQNSTNTSNNLTIGGGPGSIGSFFLNGGSLAVSNHLQIGAATDAVGTVIIGSNGAKIDAISIAAGNVTLDLSELVVDGSQTVERATNLVSEDWTDVDSFISTTTSTNWTTLVNSGLSEAFWRLDSANPAAAVIVRNQLQMGTAPNATGSLTVNAGGTLNVNSTGNSPIGDADGAQGNITVSSGGTLTSQSSLYLANATNSTGNLTVNGGTLEMPSGNIEAARAPGSSATITVSSGNLILDRNIRVAQGIDSTAEFNVSGGQVVASNLFEVGRATGATGTVNVTGGSISANNRIAIGLNTDSLGTMNISSSGSVSNSSSVFLGGGGTGILNISGGTFSMAGNQLRIPNGSPASGEINMTGGEMLVPNTLILVGRSGGPGRTGTINLVDGLIECKNFQMDLTAVVKCEITDGVIYDDYILDGSNDMARIQSYVDGGALVAADAGEVIHIDFTTAYTNSLGNSTNHMIWAGPP